MYKIKRILLLLLLPSLIWGLSSACGLGSDESSSETTTEPETSTESSAQTEETEEVEETSEAITTEPEGAEQEPSEGREATTVFAAAQMVDLSALSLPTEIKAMGRNEVGYTSFELGDDVATVVELYQPEFINDGWQNDAENEYTAETTANRYFSKDGYVVSMSVSNSGESSMVTFINNGNVDLRSLPQTTDAEPLYQFPHTVGYVSSSDVDEVVDFTRQELAAQGWQEYTMPNTATANNPDSQNLMFIQNGLELSAFIGVAPAQGNKTSVQYTTLLLPLDMPIYDEALNLEYDKHTPYLSYKTATDLETLTDFYLAEMSSLGWTELPEIATVSLEQVNLFFVGQKFYTNDAEELTVRLELTVVDGQTKVTLYQVEADEIYAAEDSQTEGDTLADNSTSTGTDTDTSDMPAFLVPDEVNNLDYYPGESLTYDIIIDMETLLDFYRQALTKTGWEESYAFIDESYSDLEFVMGDEYVYIQLNKYSDDELFALIDFSGAPSISGGAAQSSGDEQTVADSSSADMPTLPTPDDAENVVYDADFGEISYTSPSAIETLVAFYRETLSAEGWQEDEFFSLVDETTAFVEFTQNEDTLFFTMFNDSSNGQTEVSIDVSTAQALLGSDDSTSDTASTTDSGPLTADQDYEGDFPLPANYTGYSAGSSDFSQELETGSPSDLPTVLAFYLTELEALGWQPVSDTAATADTVAKTVTFEGPDGELTLDLQVSDGETQIVIRAKNRAAAEAMGVLPPAGQALIILGNWDDAELVLTIADKTFTLPPYAGEEAPDPDLMIDLPPGSYAYTLTDADGNEIEALTIEVGADETWGLIVGLDGALPLQLY